MSPAGLAWLDYSETDQRRAREIVAMFSQRESRDELGIGRIRDALSDTLFPGTSFLLTRARYLLFVPWLYREGARRGHGGPKLTQWVDWNERQLIGALHRGGDLEGLIGRFAGAAVRDLPSSLYWNALRRFGILRHDGTEGQVASLRQISRPQDEASEFLEHSDAVWAPSIPPAPDGLLHLRKLQLRPDARRGDLARGADRRRGARKPAPVPGDAGETPPGEHRICLGGSRSC